MCYIADVHPSKDVQVGRCLYKSEAHGGNEFESLLPRVLKP